MYRWERRKTVRDFLAGDFLAGDFFAGDFCAGRMGARRLVRGRKEGRGGEVEVEVARQSGLRGA